jgi:hypothetical protein
MPTVLTDVLPTSNLVANARGCTGQLICQALHAFARHPRRSWISKQLTNTPKKAFNTDISKEWAYPHL